MVDFGLFRPAAAQHVDQEHSIAIQKDDPRPAFSARLLCQNFQMIDRRMRYLSIECSIEFWDEFGGAATAEVELAALNIP